jgi:hypothetical protein
LLQENAQLGGASTRNLASTLDYARFASQRAEQKYEFDTISKPLRVVLRNGHQGSGPIAWAPAPGPGFPSYDQTKSQIKPPPGFGFGVRQTNVNMVPVPVSTPAPAPYPQVQETLRLVPPSAIRNHIVNTNSGAGDCSRNVAPMQYQYQYHQHQQPEPVQTEAQKRFMGDANFQLGNLLQDLHRVRSWADAEYWVQRRTLRKCSTSPSISYY